MGVQSRPKRTQDSFVWKDVTARNLVSGKVFRWNAGQNAIFEKYIKETYPNHKNGGTKEKLLVALDLDGYNYIRNAAGFEVGKLIGKKVDSKLDSKAREMRDHGLLLQLTKQPELPYFNQSYVTGNVGGQAVQYGGYNAPPAYAAYPSIKTESLSSEDEAELSMRSTPLPPAFAMHAYSVPQPNSYLHPPTPASPMSASSKYATASDRNTSIPGPVHANMTRAHQAHPRLKMPANGSSKAYNPRGVQSVPAKSKDAIRMDYAERIHEAWRRFHNEMMDVRRALEDGEDDDEEDLEMLDIVRSMIYNSKTHLFKEGVSVLQDYAEDDE